MGSIGYIGGNIGYMGGGPIGIEYPFEGNSSHYQLWKPPNGYFPRGEAPPPYEEAVALAQADAMNTQCTVSVATTTHRTLPVGSINTLENSTNESQTNLTTSTTNLINININNAGNLTAVATGENHQAPYSPCNMISSSSSLSNQPRSTQTYSNCSSSSSSSIGEPSNVVTRNQVNQFCVQSVPLQISQNTTTTTMFPMSSTALNVSQQQQQQQQQTQQLLQNNTQYPGVMIECTYKNCTLNSKVISSKSHKSNTQENHQQQQQQQQRYNSLNPNTNSNNETCSTAVAVIESSNAITRTSDNNNSGISSSNETQKNKTTLPILPPPLFDEGICGGGSSSSRDNISSGVIPHEIIKTPSSSRRYHRTIPRHFTAVDPLITNVKITDANLQQIDNGGGGVGGEGATAINISVATTPTSTATASTQSSTSTNKKPTCQCPVQHVPMTYMGANHFSATSPNNLFLSTLSTKLVNCRSSNNTKSTSASSSSSSSKIHTISKQSIDNPSMKMESQSSHGGGTLKRSNHHHHSNSTSNNSNNSTSYNFSSHNIGSNICNSNNNNKIATISRHVIELKHDASNVGQIHSILKTPTSKEKNSHGHNSNARNSQHCNLNNSYKACEEPFNSPFPIQFIDGSGISKISNTNTENNSENPILPPKMHKNSNFKQTSNPVFVSKIHTITKPNEMHHQHHHHQSIPSRTTSNGRSSHHPSSVLTYHYDMSNPSSSSNTAAAIMSNAICTSTSTYNTKSLPRKDEKITHALTLPNSSGPLYNTEKSQSLGKINSSTYYPIQNGHATYTLPKPNNGKISLNSTITSVVNKVPSVINIPSSPSSSALTTTSLPPASTSASLLVTSPSYIENGGQQQQQQQNTTTTQTVITATSNSKQTSNSNNINQHHHSIDTQTNNKRNPLNSSNPSEMMNKSPKLSQTVPTESNMTKLNNFMPKNNNKLTTATTTIITNSSSTVTATTSSSSLTTNSMKNDEKPLPVCTTSKNCSNPKEHFLPNDTSLDDDYLSECENCKTAHSSRYYLDKEIEDAPPETMTLQRKMENDKEDEQTYYRTSLTLPTNTKKTTTIKNNRETWFSSIPASSSSDEETNE